MPIQEASEGDIRGFARILIIGTILIIVITLSSVLYSPARTIEITQEEIDATFLKSEPNIDFKPFISETGNMTQSSTNTPYIAILGDYEDMEIEESKIKAIILNVAMDYDVDGELLLDLAWKESTFNHKARNAEGSTGTGLYQWIEGSWDYYCGDLGDLDARFDPYLNTECTARTIKEVGLSPWTADRRTYTYLQQKGYVD